MFPSTFRRLEVFITAVEAGSFVAAAERLGISHPSVSNHIAALERQVRARLFVRRRGAVSALTEQGRRLYDRARRLLEEAQQLSGDLAPNRPGAKRPRLTLATQRILAQHVLRRPICDYIRTEPHVEFVLDAGIFEQAIASLTDGEADLCCVMTSGTVAGLESEIIGRERFALYVATHHPLAGKSKITPSELSRYPFLSTRRDGHYGQMIHNLLASSGIKNYSVAHQFQEGGILNEVAAQGKAIACSFEPATAEFLRNNTLVELDVDAPSMVVELNLIWPSRRRASTHVRQLADMLRRRLRLETT
jgi:DNA-binding transcriptional LysR family regulator